MIWELKGTSGLQTDMTFEYLKETLEVLDFIIRKKDKEFHYALLSLLTFLLLVCKLCSFPSYNYRIIVK